MYSTTPTKESFILDYDPKNSLERLRRLPRTPHNDSEIDKFTRWTDANAILIKNARNYYPHIDPPYTSNLTETASTMHTMQLSTLLAPNTTSRTHSAIKI